MSQESPDAPLSDLLAKHLPYLRRYARALSGSQTSGDRYAIAALEAIVADTQAVKAASSAKVGLFQVFHAIWASSGASVGEDESAGDSLEDKAQLRLRSLTPNTREALLLNSVEGFSRR